MLTMLATALMGGQVFAEVTGTGIEGYDKSVSSGSDYYGKYSETESVSGGNVTVKKETTGQVPNDAQVIGGRSKAGEASNNMVTMQGGTVRSIYGGNGSTGASNNTVTMQGGSVSGTIYGGWGSTGASNNTVTMQGGSVSGTISGGNGGTAGDSYNNTVVMTGGSAQTLHGGNSGNNYTASGNVVIVTGGSISSILSAGYAGVGTHNNKMHLVGNGASNVNIADAQGVISTSGYTGDVAGISLYYVFGGYASQGTSTGNSIDIYGTGIRISGMLSRMQILTFNITDGQMTGQNAEAALSLTSANAKEALNLADVGVQIKNLDVQEWTPGASITLVQSAQAIQGLEDGKMVDITNATGAKVAQGKLQLVNGLDGTHLLNLTVQGNVPEPTTGTLSLLALAALAARRRK